MNTLRFNRRESASSLAQNHQKSKTRRRFRQHLLVITGALGLLFIGALSWQQRGQAAPEAGTSGHRLAELLSRAGQGLRSALALSPAPAQAAQGGLTISTIAGGGFDIDLPVGQAPAGEPSGVIRDALKVRDDEEHAHQRPQVRRHGLLAGDDEDHALFDFEALGIDPRVVLDNLLGPAMIPVPQRLHRVHQGLRGHGPEDQDLVLEFRNLPPEEVSAHGSSR